MSGVEQFCRLGQGSAEHLLYFLEVTCGLRKVLQSADVQLTVVFDPSGEKLPAELWITYVAGRLLVLEDLLSRPVGRIIEHRILSIVRLTTHLVRGEPRYSHSSSFVGMCTVVRDYNTTNLIISQYILLMIG